LSDEVGYVLGVDGGGSNTRCVIVELSGSIVSRGSAGPSNPLTAGAESACKAIIEAVEEALNQCSARRFKAACLGLAGVERPHGRESVQRIVANRIPAERVLIVSDAAAAFAGTIGFGVGVVVVAGTGSIAYGVNAKGKTARAGGWGWIVGDEGSGYDIGKRAIAVALRAYDGRDAPTKLVQLIKKALNLSDLTEIIDHLYVTGMKPHEVASLAPIVAEAAESGDQVALHILNEAGYELAHVTMAVIKKLRLHGHFIVAKTGGVFQMGTSINDAFERAIGQAAPECCIISSRFEPAVGAAFLALQEVGVEIDEALLEKVAVSLEALGR